MGTNLGNRPMGTGRSAFTQAGTIASQNYYDPTQENSFELKSKLYSDPAAYAFAINDWLGSWRNSKNVPNSNFVNELDYIQFLLRGSGLSSEKEGVSRGLLTTKDLAGLKTASEIALANGIGFKDVLKSIFESKQALGEGGPKYSKQIASSLKLIDIGDAQSKLSEAYFNMFGVYPSQENIKAFKQRWNDEVRKQEAVTTTQQVTGKGGVVVGKGKGKKSGTGAVTQSRTITKGEGFTEAEQAQTMADFLATQFTKENMGGAVKTIFDGIKKMYRDNFLPEPTYESVASIVKDLATTPDETSYTTKLNQVSQSVRDKAAKFFPALADDLKNGKDISETSDIYFNSLAKKWGAASADALKRDPEALELVKSALNVRDDKGNARIMDLNELNITAQKSKRYLEGTEFLSTVGNFGDKLIAAMGGGR